MAGVEKKIMDWPEGATTAIRGLGPEQLRSLAYLVITYLESHGLPEGTVTIGADVTVRLMIITEFVPASGSSRPDGAAAAEGPSLFDQLLSEERGSDD